MKVRLNRFGYPDFGQATHTHPEGNPNDFNTALPKKLYNLKHRFIISSQP
jgi:hypothetical protein